MSDMLVSESSLYTTGDYPLAHDTLFGFDLIKHRPEEIGYMPQLGFLALNEEGKKHLIGFCPEGTDRVLYAHPGAVLGLLEPTYINVCSVQLSSELGIFDTRQASQMSWSGRIKDRLLDIGRASPNVNPMAEAIDILIEPQPLTEAFRQATRQRTFRINRYLPSCAARILNPELAIRRLGGRGA